MALVKPGALELGILRVPYPRRSCFPTRFHFTSVALFRLLMYLMEPPWYCTPTFTWLLIHSLRFLPGFGSLFVCFLNRYRVDSISRVRLRFHAVFIEFWSDGRVILDIIVDSIEYRSIAIERGAIALGVCIRRVSRRSRVTILEHERAASVARNKKNSRNRPFFSNIFILFPPNSIQQFRWSVIFLCVCVCVCYCSSRKIPERGKRRKELTKGPDQKKIWNLKKTDQKTKQRSCRCLMRPYMARPYSLNERTRVLIGWPFWAAWYITHERGLSTVSRCLPNLRKKKKSGNKKRVREETWRRQTWVKKKRSQLVSR